MTRRNHDGISHFGHFLFIVRHEFLDVPEALANFGHDAMPHHGHIDSLVHLVGNDGANERAAGILARWRVNEIPTRDRTRVGQFLVRHVSNRGIGKGVVIHWRQHRGE